MSVLKSILHHWNSTSKAYDTLHPETEAAQVTDWHKSIIGSLASKVLPTVVSELTTDSVMGKLMKMLLTATGVRYSIDTNGYVCLGSFFGGLIIQWGRYNGTGRKIKYPLTFSTVFTFVTSGGYSIIIPAITGEESDILSEVPYFARVTNDNTMQNDTGSKCQIYWVAFGA